jgi:hypothetical protein
MKLKSLSLMARVAFGSKKTSRQARDFFALPLDRRGSSG